MIKVDLNQINSFKNYMKFFQVAKVSNDLGISSRNKVPNINEPKDIVSKTATVMSRLLSGENFTPIIEVNTPLARYTVNATYNKKRTPNGFDYNSVDALPRNLEYNVGIGISSNALSKIPVANLAPLDISSLKNILYAAAHYTENASRTYGAVNNLGYYAETFFRAVERSNAFIIAPDYTAPLFAAIEELKNFGTAAVGRLQLANNRHNTTQFGTNPNVAFGFDYNNTFNRYYAQGSMFRFNGRNDVDGPISLNRNFNLYSNYRSDSKLVVSNISLNVTDLDEAYAAFSNPLAALNMENKKYFRTAFDFANYFGSNLFGLNINEKTICIFNIRLKNLDNGAYKDITYVVSNTDYKEINMDLQFKLNFTRAAFEDYASLTNGLEFIKTSYESFVNGSMRVTP